MDPRTKIENGAFMSATQILEYVIAQRLISREQAEVIGTSELSILTTPENLDDRPKGDVQDGIKVHDEIGWTTNRFSAGSDTIRPQRRRNTQNTAVKKCGEKAKKVMITDNSTEIERSLRRSPRKKKSEK
jgi:hypothetical protein